MNENKVKRANTKGHPIYWTWEMLLTLGTIPDTVLSDAWGISLITIRKKRKQLGIERFRLTNEIDIECDEEDKVYLGLARWQLYGKYYSASRRINGEMLFHRVILAPIPDGLEVDHINGDTKNNRKSNLRLCTRSQNIGARRITPQSLSGYRGVDKLPHGKYKARIVVKGRNINLGHYSDPEEVARAYDKGALKYFGEFARTNFRGEL